MKEILIYCDKGISLGSYYRLVYALQGGISDQYRIRAVHHRFFLTEGWEKRSALLVFPGGRDLPYQQALSGEGNRRIRDYVHGGGRFLGICAGGYYGSCLIEFDRGGPLEVNQARELGFFKGKAIGPAYREQKFSYISEEGARGAPILWEGGITSVYFNGGCFFEGTEGCLKTQVLGRYSDLQGQPAAVIHCEASKGAALLCGVHPEYNPNLFWYYLLNKILT